MRSLSLLKPAEPMHEGKLSADIASFQATDAASCCMAIFAHCGAAEVTMFDEGIVFYKVIGDLMFYVTGSRDENELILSSVLTALYESVTLLLR